MNVEELVVQKLSSGHVSIHIICKSYTLEKLDKCCINALSEANSELKITEMIIKRHPRLKPLVHQPRSAAVCALNALLKIVAYDQSGKRTSLTIIRH